MVNTIMTSTSPAPSPPHPSSTLVNVSEDADIRLIRVLAPSTPSPEVFESTCASCIASKDAAGLLRTIIQAPGAVRGLLMLDSVDESVSAFSLLAALLDRVGNSDTERELVAALADSLTIMSGDEDSLEMREKRSAMVAALFNLRSDGVEKVRLLTHIVDLSDASALAPGLPRGVSILADTLDPLTLKSSLKLWGAGSTPAVEKRQLYKAVVRGMDRVLERLEDRKEGNVASVEGEMRRKVTAARERRQMFLLLILDTYEDESQLDSEALSYVQQATLAAIVSPITHFTSHGLTRLIHLPAIKSLRIHSPPLYDLLQLFHTGKLQDYRDFTAMPDKNTVFGEFGLEEDECRKNMCLLSLVSLASEHQEEIPYSAIAETLDVPMEEVERWVILGVSSGLMEAKMDQLRKMVLVERCVVRQFGEKEWMSLKGRLDKWKDNVRGVLEALEKSRSGVNIEEQ